MPNLWTLDEFDAHDPSRADHLRSSPPWTELVQSVRQALRTAIATTNVAFGFDESGKDLRDLRGVVQFPLGRPLFDWFFNGTTGYRAQFRIGRTNGITMNAQLIREIAEELQQSATNDIVIHRLTPEFSYKESGCGKITQIAATLETRLSKVWACEKLIGQSGQIQELFVSRTGPKLVFQDTDSWSSFYPENADGWLDVKGAFLGTSGPYQLKPPEDRAANLEERGSA